MLAVYWEGAQPRPGDFLAPRRGSYVWEIRGVERLQARLPSDPRFRLDVRRRRPQERPTAAVLHEWRRTVFQDPTAPPTVRVRPGRAPAGGRLEEAPGGPTAVMKGSWVDPLDIRPNASKRPRTIAGWRTFCSLRRMMQNGSQIQEWHILAADFFRGQVDLAAIGATTPKDTGARGGAFGPTTGPTVAAILQASAGDQVRRAFRRIPQSRWRMVLEVVLRNQSIHAWCKMLEAEDPMGRAPDPKVEMGRLLTILDILAEVYSADINFAVATDQMLATA